MNQEQEDFTKSLKVLSRALPFGPQELDAVLIRCYWDLFGSKTPSWEDTFKKAMITCKRWPTIAELHELAGNNFKEPNKQDVARELVDLIFDCVSSIGAYRGTEAENKIGTLGMSVLKSYGGWQSFCQQFDSYDQIPTVKAQLRGSIEAKLNIEGMDRAKLPSSLKTLLLT